MLKSFSMLCRYINTQYEGGLPPVLSASCLSCRRRRVVVVIIDLFDSFMAGSIFAVSKNHACNEHSLWTTAVVLS